MNVSNSDILVVVVVAGLLLSTTASAAPASGLAGTGQSLQTDFVEPPGYNGSEDDSWNNSSRSDTPDNAGPGDAVTRDDEKRTLSYQEQIRNNSVLSSTSDGWKPAQPSSVTSLDESVDPEKADRVVVKHANGTVTTYESTNRGLNAEASSQKTPPDRGLFADRTARSQGTQREVEPESVIGSDDRQRITNTDSYPWRTIVELRIVTADGTTIGCTGALIDPNHVLTAGHCVYSHEYGDDWVQSIEVVPGANGSEKPYHHAKATYYRSYTGWTNNADNDWDMGLITLDRNIGDYTGWMGRYTDSESSNVYDTTVNVAGYPCDKATHTQWWDANSGDGTFGNAFGPDPHHAYWMDTAGCMSGGPVWLYDYWGNEERYIVTVHAYGRKGQDSNYGTRLTNNKFNDINDWLDEDSRSTDKPDLVDDGTEWAGFSPDPVTHGEELTVWNDVRNVGTASTGCFWVDYYASTDYTISASEDYLIGYDQVCNVDPFTYKDAQSTLTISSDDVPSGNYVVGAIIDSQDDVDEFSESNNEMVITDDFLEVNARPDPSYEYTPTEPNVDETVTFDGSTSSDSDGSIERYAWDFDGDGTTDATGSTVTHAFSSSGKYAVTLTVTDDDGATANVSKTVSVTSELPPVGDFENPPNDLDGDGKYEDVNGDDTFDVVDVQALFANRDDSTIENNPEKFDFNDDGAINVVDVQRLFVMLTE